MPAARLRPRAPATRCCAAGDAIATRLSQSWQSIPHIFLSSSVDMTGSIPAAAMLNSGSSGAEANSPHLGGGRRRSPLHHQRLNAWLLGDDTFRLAHTPAQWWPLGHRRRAGGRAHRPVVLRATGVGSPLWPFRVAELARLARASYAGLVTGAFTISGHVRGPSSNRRRWGFGCRPGPDGAGVEQHGIRAAVDDADDAVGPITGPWMAPWRRLSWPR